MATHNPATDIQAMDDKADTSIRTGSTNHPQSVTEYRFAEFRLSARQQCLYRAGEPVQITTKIYYLLLTFVQFPGEILTKDAIVKAVWPGQVVTDTALAKQVLRLRQILRDAERDMPLIETHRGVGYRLTCPVKTVPDVQAAASEAGRWAPRPVAIYSAAATLLVTIALLVLYGSATTSSTDTVAATLPAIAVLPAADDTPALSGAAAAYIAARLGERASIVPALPGGDEGGDTAMQSLQVRHISRLPQATALKLSENAGNYVLDITFRGGTEEDHQTTRISSQGLAETLEAGVEWLTRQMAATGQESGLELRAPPTRDAYALDSYLRGLEAMHGSGSRERAAEYFRAAISSDSDFLQAHLRLGEVENSLGRQYEAIAIASALLATPELSAQPELALDTHLLVARAYRGLGDNARAREQLTVAEDLVHNAINPYKRLTALAALALMAQLDRDLTGAYNLGTQRLELAEDIYPLPAFIATIHLELASFLEHTGQPDRLRHHAEAARRLAEETGDAEMLVSSYRYLASHYFSANDIDSAVQLAVAAQPFLDKVAASEDKAYFLQYSAMALNLRGLFDLAINYTTRLRAAGEQAGNPMYGAIADFTVMHRLYIQGAFEEARAMASSTRARFATDAVTRAAIPQALAFEAIVTARSSPPATTLALLAEFDERYADSRPALEQTLLRARGHLAVRQGNIERGIELLRESEEMHRQQGHYSVAAFVGYEIAEIRLAHDAEAPWDDLERLNAQVGFDYHLARLQAQAHAREQNFLAAATSLENSRLRSNDLWSVRDERLLERYRGAMASRNTDHEDHSPTLEPLP